MSKKEEIQNRMMDYLYDEMDDQKKKAFETLIHEQPELKKELEELRMTRNLLSNHPSAVPPFQPLLSDQPEAGHEPASKPDQPGNGHIVRLSPFVKNLAAIAASLLIVILGMAFAGVEAGSTENGFYLMIGSPPAETVAAEADLTEERVAAMLEQMQTEQAVLLAGWMEEVQSRQDRQVHELFTLMNEHYEVRRQQDLRVIAAGINELEVETQNRFDRTNTALGNLIYALSTTE